MDFLLHLSKWFNQVVNIVTDSNTEQRILEAAKKVFLKKGSAGARMQDIADAAGINKALLHYYFRSKEKLFETIFREATGKLMPRIRDIFTDNQLDFFTRVEAFVEAYIRMGIENPYLPIFVIHELHTGNGDSFKKIIADIRENPMKMVVASISAAVKDGTIRPVDPLQFLIHMVSLCMFPVVARPMFQQLAGLSDKQYEKFLEERKDEVVMLLRTAMLPERKGAGKPYATGPSVKRKKSNTAPPSKRKKSIAPLTGK